VKITYTNHAQRRMRERAVSGADVRNVLSARVPAHPSSKKRELWGRTVGGTSLKVVYTEESWRIPHSDSLKAQPLNEMRALMRIEYDREANVVYVYLWEDIPYGEAARTKELGEGVYLDTDREGRALGLEFVELSDFLGYLERHNGRIEVPVDLSVREASGLSRI
jgi:uncharacterized protein YuzE